MDEILSAGKEQWQRQSSLRKVEFYGALYASVNSTPTGGEQLKSKSGADSLSNVLVCWWEQVGVVSSDLLSLGPHARTTPTQRRDETNFI